MLDGDKGMITSKCFRFTFFIAIALQIGLVSSIFVDSGRVMSYVIERLPFSLGNAIDSMLFVFYFAPLAKIGTFLSLGHTNRFVDILILVPLFALYSLVLSALICGITRMVRRLKVTD